MRFVEELVVEEFLPTFRSLLAEALRERGHTQSEVARLLGISQSAVSKYVHGDVERNESILADERLQRHVETLADGLTDGELDRVQALVETEVLIRELERGGVLARLHEDAEPGLADLEYADAVHDPDSRARAAGRALADVRRGLRILEATGGFAALIPAVGSNLVRALPDAESVADVAGVPGRILDVKGRATFPADPEFGVSEHVATLLLAARESGHDGLAAANVRYDEDLLARFVAAGHDSVAFDPEKPLSEAVTAALESSPGADVLFQSGAYGVEPVCYVLGPDAATVAERIRAVA